MVSFAVMDMVSVSPWQVDAFTCQVICVSMAVHHVPLSLTLEIACCESICVSYESNLAIIKVTKNSTSATCLIYNWLCKGLPQLHKLEKKA